MKKSIALLAAALVANNLLAQTVDVSQEGTELNHFWSVGVGAGRANEGLRASWLEHLQEANTQCGFQYVRMHGHFDDDMFVYFEHDGKAAYSWQYIDDVYDRMLAIGVRPFVELAFFPTGIAPRDSKIQMWYRNKITPGEGAIDKWYGLVKAFAQHLVDRYGLDEVSKWYFEVWNEPNLNPGFADFDKDYYFQLYKASAKALKEVSGRLKVGGPATSNFVADTRFDGPVYDKSKSIFYPQDKINKQQWKGVWVEDFINFCTREGLPVDFVSTHTYPTDYALDPETGRGRGSVRYVHSLRDDLTWLRKTIAVSRFKDAEIHVTEWSTSPNSRDDMHDCLPPAAYIVKTSLECLGLVNSVMYWTFTDVFEEKGGGETIFHGGFGLINYQGIKKPSFHAYCMLNALGDRTLYNADPLFVSRDSKTGKTIALAYNYPEEYTQTVPSPEHCTSFMNAKSKSLDFTLTHLPARAVFQIETLDYNHGNVMRLYEEMGKPHNPTAAQVEALKAAALSTKKETVKADDEGRLHITCELPAWTCMLIRQLN